MKAKWPTLITACLIFTHAAIADEVDNANKTLLPESYTIYTNGTSVLNHPEPGFIEKAFPTINLYKGNPGCYIACYSQQKENAIYALENNVYVLGQVRVAGRYNNALCVPTNFAGKDISADTVFKTICTEKIPTCVGGHCWANGYTGGWFGISNGPDEMQTVQTP